MANEPQSIVSSEHTSIQPSTTTSGYADNGTSSLTFESTSQCSANELGSVKYKYFYHRLYKCLCYLEMENRKLLQAIQQKIRVTGEPKRLDELLDEFAFKVASKKDAYEKSLTAQATAEGQQAYMAKRWKMRYLNLLGIASLFESKFRPILPEEDKKDSQDLLAPQSDINEHQNGEGFFFDEVLSVPWDSHANPGTKLQNIVEDIDCEGDEGKRLSSSYEFDDFTIFISSVFIQDLLANHNLHAEEIKRQNEIKSRLFHVLKKTKEQRNQLKKYVTDQELEIQLLEKNIRDTEALMLISKQGHTSIAPHNRNRSTHRKDSDKAPSPSSTPILQVREASQEPCLVERREVEKLQAEVKLLEFRKLELEGMLREEEQQRRILSKRLQDLVGAIHVSCRIKPHPNNYLQIVSDDKLLCPKSLPLVTNAGRLANGALGLNADQMRCFIFEKVLGPGTGHHEIFKKIAQPLSQCLDGQNMCIMTYGPRKSGKSFTMFGSSVHSQKVGDSIEAIRGIAQDAVHQLISLIRQRAAWTYTVHVQAMYVNDAKVVDLLKDIHCVTTKPTTTCVTEDTPSICSTMRSFELTGGLDFENFVHEVQDRENSKKGTQPAHLLIQLIIRGVQKCDKDTLVQSTLLLAELASWEKRTNTDEFDMLSTKATPLASESNSHSSEVNTPVAGKSNSGVNQSLLALSRVFTALRKRKMPSFKDSPLTQLFSPVLTGESKCFLIITINSDPNEFTSTLASLQFAQNAMQATPKLVTDQRVKRVTSVCLEQNS
ncbi:hypothetical protein EG68_09834 [Paragonimus skrjabini miyazakii]|uniref:Kinesin motor domain-containing protein n=1 Tax=Paragonimus skrjabini miyazakii TaxID=59628 RepID=A0A8S9YAU3_9TREM|nr:hypothetical protein EG68_09834 [Paragonimus skrjabini miyazakii]